MASAVAGAAMVGALIATQTRINGDLNKAGAGPLVAGWVSYLGTLIAIVLVIVLRGRWAPAMRAIRDRGEWWWWAVGLCGIPIVISSAYGVPIVGVAVATVGSVAGQTVSGLVLDSRGVGLTQRLPLTGRRMAAAATALVGLGLSMAAGTGAHGVDTRSAIFIGGLFFIGGACISVQNAGNGAVARNSGEASIAGLTSVVGGMAGITVVLGVSALAGALATVSMPTAMSDWYRYLGGPLGAGVVITAAWAVQRLGTFALTLAVVAGQMLTAIALDATRGTFAGPATLASMAASVVATALGVTPRQPSSK